MTTRNSDLAPVVHKAAMGERLFGAGDVGIVWRVSRGVFRLEAEGPQGNGFVRLAFPGDLLGAETLTGACHAHSAVALLSAEAHSADGRGGRRREQLLAEALQQWQVRCAEAVRMRHGAVSERLGRLLVHLESATGMDTRALRSSEFPTLRDISAILDTAPESICRGLAGLSGQAGLRTTRHAGKPRKDAPPSI